MHVDKNTKLTEHMCYKVCFFCFFFFSPIKFLVSLDYHSYVQIRRFFFVLCLPEGVILISLALCADAVIGNVQEKAMKLHNASNSEMVNTQCFFFTSDGLKNDDILTCMK